MEEADVLCNRIGIVSNGVLKCIGSQTLLKNLYGGGYHLYVNC
jgi:ABC-type multidrug transport system ATPase subunit